MKEKEWPFPGEVWECYETKILITRERHWLIHDNDDTNLTTEAISLHGKRIARTLDEYYNKITKDN